MTLYHQALTLRGTRMTVLSGRFLEVVATMQDKPYVLLISSTWRTAWADQIRRPSSVVVGCRRTAEGERGKERRGGRGAKESEEEGRRQEGEA